MEVIYERGAGLERERDGVNREGGFIDWRRREMVMAMEMEVETVGDERGYAYRQLVGGGGGRRRTGFNVRSITSAPCRPLKIV